VVVFIHLQLSCYRCVLMALFNFARQTGERIAGKAAKAAAELLAIHDPAAPQRRHFVKAFEEPR
jgi:hypothetical protein